MGYVIVMLSGCESGQAGIDKSEWPHRLVFGVFPQESPDVTKQRYANFVQHLEDELGVRVELQVPNSYAMVIRGMRSKYIHFAEFGPRSYVKAAEQANAEVFARKVFTDGSRGYRSIIISKKGSNIKRLSHLTGKRWAFVDPNSTSGTLVPSVELHEARINPKLDFASVVYSGSHENSTLMVRNNEVDAASTNEVDFLAGVEKGLWREDEFNIIWRSLLIPSNPIAYRSDLPLSLRHALKDAFINYQDEAVLKELNLQDFIAANDDEYDFVRKMVEFKQRLEQRSQN